MRQARFKGSGKPFFNSWRLSLVGVLTLAFLVYLPSLHGGPVWEDPLLISGDGTGGKTLAGAFTHHFLSNSYYRPLTSASFFFDRIWSDQTPYFFHFSNMALHAFTALLVCCLGLMLTRKPLAGVLAGVFFAVQPAQIGAVAWIGGRTDALSCFFLVLTATTLLAYYRSGRIGWCVASVFAFLAAVLAKEQSLALLPAIAVSPFVFGSKKWREAALIVTPFAACALVYLGLSRLPGEAFYQSVGQLDSARTPVLTAANYGLSFLAPTPVSQLTFSLGPLQGIGWTLAGILVIAAAIGVGAFLWKRSRPLAWIYLCGLLLYLPVANFIAVPSFWVAPYRMAETGIFVACLCGTAAAYVYTMKKALPGLVLAGNLAAGAFVTCMVVRDWRNGDDLNELILQRDPHLVTAQLSRVDSFLDKKDYLGAATYGDKLLSWLFGTNDWAHAVSPATMAEFQPALRQRLHETYGSPDMVYAANALCKQAKALFNLHLSKQAVAATEDGLYFAPRDPNLNFEYGCEIVASNRTEAIQHFQIAYDMQPDSPQFAATLGIEKLEVGDYRAATTLLERATSEAPFMGILWVELSDARLGLKDYPGAIDALNLAAKHMSDPDGIAARKAKILKMVSASSGSKSS